VTLAPDRRRRTLAQLAFGPVHTPNRILVRAQRDLVAQLGDVGQLAVQSADRIVEHRQRRAQTGVLADPDLAGTLPAPQCLIESLTGDGEVMVECLDDPLGVAIPGEPRLEDDGMLDDDWIQRGAGTDANNFRSWTITKNGLGINFDSYQVGPYAAGPQYVLVPYSTLKEIIRPDGPVAQFVK